MIKFTTIPFSQIFFTVLRNYHPRYRRSSSVFYSKQFESPQFLQDPRPHFHSFVHRLKILKFGDTLSLAHHTFSLVYKSNQLTSYLWNDHSFQIESHTYRCRVRKKYPMKANKNTKMPPPIWAALFTPNPQPLRYSPIQNDTLRSLRL